ncbi:MAG: hypothetical protein R2854_10050 [Caldilineaceae bacterium]
MSRGEVLLEDAHYISGAVRPATWTLATTAENLQEYTAQPGCLAVASPGTA